jgi:hypothetical protein
LPKGTADSVLARMFPPENLYEDDPVGWVEEYTGEFLWSKQREVCESVSAERYTAVHSAHGTGKSFTASRIVAWWLSAHPVGEAFAITTAPTAAQVDAILWREIRKVYQKLQRHPQIERRNLGRVTLDSKWYMGGDELVAYGRKPADYDEAAFQGIHARYVLVVIDEAGGVPEQLFNAIDSVVTNDNSRVLAIGNPDDPASHFARICEPNSGWNKIHISAFDTPAFTGEEVPEDILPMLTSPNWVEERKKRWGEGSPIYISKVEGLFPEVTQDTLITPAMIKRAHLQDLNDFEHGIFSLDVARKGDDRTCLYRNRGGKIRKVWETHADDTMKTAGKAKRELDDLDNQVSMVVDVIGVGAGVYDRMKEQDCPVIGFNASNKAQEPKKFKNLRAEQWWKLREKFENDEVDLDPEDEELAAELVSVKWWINSSGQIQLESKEDMKKRGLPSPDHADAVMMSTVDDDILDMEVFTQEFVRVHGITDDLLERPM